MSEKDLTTSRETALNREATRSRSRYLAPPVDIYETAEGLTLVADVPGLDRQNLEISVDQGILTIEGQAACGGGELIWREYAMDGYWRQFQIPDTFDVARATAEISDGVLTLQLPKAEVAKPRRIAVTTRH